MQFYEHCIVFGFYCMVTRKERYDKWLKEREKAAHSFGVPVDNSRTNIINIAMDDVLRNNIGYFEVGLITDNEAAMWMSQNILKLESTRHTGLLIAILIDEINYVNDVIAGAKEDDKKARPTVEKMREMIEILQRPRPVSSSSASASSEPPVPEVEPEDDKTKFSKMYPIPKTKPDALTVLNLPANATKKQIRTAYTDLSLLLHPDKNTPDEQIEYTARQQQVTEAYNMLKQEGGKKRRTTQRKSLKKSNSKKLNKHFNKSRKSRKTKSRKTKSKKTKSRRH